jgi:hypothetical protein
MEDVGADLGHQRLGRELHDEMAAGLRDFLMRYSSSEFEVLVKMLGDLMKAEKVGVRICPGE